MNHGHERSGLPFAVDELTCRERPSAAGLHAYAGNWPVLTLSVCHCKNI